MAGTSREAASGTNTADGLRQGLNGLSRRRLMAGGAIAAGGVLAACGSPTATGSTGGTGSTGNAGTTAAANLQGTTVEYWGQWAPPHSEEVARLKVLENFSNQNTLG